MLFTGICTTQNAQQSAGRPCQSMIPPVRPRLPLRFCRCGPSPHRLLTPSTQRNGRVRTQLDNVSNRTHHHESNPDSLRNLDELALVGYVRTVSPAGQIRGILAGTEQAKGNVRFVHLFRNWVPSRRKSRGMSASSLNWSAMVGVLAAVLTE